MQRQCTTKNHMACKQKVAVEFSYNSHIFVATLNMRLTLLLCLVFFSYAAAAGQTYDQTYLQGLEAYRRKDWKLTILYMRQVVDEYSRLEEARLKCYNKCSRQKPKTPSDYVDDEQLRFFHSLSQRSHCIQRCEEDRMGLLPQGGVPQDVFEKLKRRASLNYLQMALQQDNQHRDAAQAYAQYSYLNPLDQHVKINTPYYKALKGVTEKDLQPKITFKYRDLYVEGDNHYYDKDYSSLVDTFEKALPEFYKEVEKCKSMCEGPIKYSSTVDFAQAMTTVHLLMVDCQTKCSNKLGSFRSQQKDDFFGSFFHYLQYGYYFLNQTDDAVEASAAQLRLTPNSLDAKKVADFYKKKTGVSVTGLKPREDVLSEILKQEAVVKYHRFLDDRSGRLTKAIQDEEWGVGEEGADHKLVRQLEEDFINYPVIEQHHTIEERETRPEPVVVQTAADYGGLERMLVDQLLTEQECSRLIQLASFGREGDGYGHNKSPHTKSEKFVGLHVLDSAKKSSFGDIDPSLSWLYVNASKRSKEMVSKVFNLDKPLYFSYTHLVCRLSNEGMQDDRNDLSHPVHSDNCILDDHGECNKVPPAYTWRDYSALLYLNGEFDGGEFFYAHSTKDLSPDVLVKPKCGRLVGFSAGKENMHGVKAVTNGKRCAVALWFTMDSRYNERAFDEAEQILSNLL